MVFLGRGIHLPSAIYQGWIRNRCREADDTLWPEGAFLSSGVGFNKGSDDTIEPARPILSSACREIEEALVNRSWRKALSALQGDKCGLG